MKATLEQWRMLLAVVDAGGFAQASAAIHKSQSTINHGVNKLQEQLGVRVLEVVGRKAQVTEQGEVVLRRARQLIEAAEGLEGLASEMGKEVEARISLAVDIIFPESVLFEVLERFSALYPYTRIEIIETALSGAAEKILAGEADLAISGPTPTHFLSEPLLQMDFIAVASPQHPLHELGRPLNEQDLRMHRQVVVRDSATKERSDSGWLGADQRWTVSHMSTSVTVVRGGLAFAWLPSSRILEHLQSGELKPLPLVQGVSRKAALNIYLADPEGAGEATRSLKELLEALAASWVEETDNKLRPYLSDEGAT